MILPRLGGRPGPAAGGRARATPRDGRGRRSRPVPPAGRGGRRSSSRPRATRARRARRRRSTGSTTRRAAGALVFHAGTARPPGRRLRHERRAGAGGRRAVAGSSPRARDAAERAADAISLGRRCSAGTTSPPDAAAVAGVGASPRDPRATRCPRWARSGPTRRASSGCCGSSSPVAGPRRARGLVPAERLAAIEAGRRVDVDRIAEIERTTDHDVIAFVQPGRRDRRAGRPLPAPRADEQRRRRHGARPPAAGRAGRALLARLRPAPRRARGPGPRPRPAP